MSPAVTSRVALRFVVVLLMCSAFLLHISAKDETLKERRMSAEAARQQALLDQKRQQFKNHSSSSMTDFEKRLQAMEAWQTFGVKFFNLYRFDHR